MPVQTKTPPLIEGGSPTIFITDMSRAVHFYTDVLGLKVAYRAGDKFCMIDAGGGFMIGLHPRGEHSPAPGTSGSIEVGFNVNQPIEQVVDELIRCGVRFQGPVINDDNAVKLAPFHDPDGNELYLCEVLH
jgi:catechol 2,3-dioxygenase-like lactoylglutathione lyase family enzyme